MRRATSTIILAAILSAGSVFATAGSIFDAALIGDAQEVAKFIAADPKLVHAKSELGSTPLHIAANTSSPEMAKSLIAKGANVNVHDGRGVTPLQLAVTLGFPEGVELLVSQRARVDEPNSEGETPLISAVHRRDTALMRVLLKAGANPDRADNSGRSARDYALLNGPGNSLINEITSNAKPAGQRSGPQRSYGPTL